MGCARILAKRVRRMRLCRSLGHLSLTLGLADGVRPDLWQKLTTPVAGLWLCLLQFLRVLFEGVEGSRPDLRENQTNPVAGLWLCLAVLKGAFESAEGARPDLWQKPRNPVAGPLSSYAEPSSLIIVSVSMITRFVILITIIVTAITLATPYIYHN